ncbi:putative nuclease HARBI1 isoform X2 [Oncorhynchus nerka]
MRPIFVNRKSFHSINVQMVCNADCVISNVVAKWPGSVHDSRIFRASEIYQCLSQGEFSGVLLGDRGYGCQPFLLTPFTDPQEAQQAYNHAHARTRARVEMTFGLLKARFHCLHKLRVSPVRACDITVACAVLHNVACLRKERAPRVPPAMDWDNPAIFPDDDSGRLLRDQYVLNYFS